MTTNTREGQVASLVLPLAYYTPQAIARRRDGNIQSPSRTSSKLYRPKKEGQLKAGSGQRSKFLKSLAFQHCSEKDYRDNTRAKQSTMHPHAAPVQACHTLIMIDDVLPKEEDFSHEQTHELQHLIGELRSILASKSISGIDDALRSQNSSIELASTASVMSSQSSSIELVSTASVMSFCQIHV